MKFLLNLALIIAFGMAVTFSACKKYDEGPTLSLAGKKARVVNEWKLEKIMINGVDCTSLMTNYSLEIKKDNTYIITFIGSSTTGKWDFDSKKENLLFTPNGSSSASKGEIIKLKSKELWLKYTDGSTVTEVHYEKD